MSDFMDRFIKLLKKNKIFIWIFILVITLIWGYAWVVMKQSLNYMGPYTFSAYRFIAGTITLLLVVWLTKQHIPLKKYWKQLAFLGLLQTTVVYLFVMFGLQFIGAGKSSVLLYSMPIWGSLLAIYFLKEKLNLTGMIGLFLGLIGLLLIIGWDFLFESNKQVLIGQILIVIAAISWAISNIYFRIRFQDLPKITTTAYQMLFGTIGIVFVAIFYEWNEPAVFNAHSIYYILFSGIIASALCFTMWFVLLSLVDMMTATISSMLVPVFGLIFSYLILDEQLTINLLLGSAIIIIGIVVSQLKQRQRSKNER